jgi:hypothetical protein
MPQRKVGRLPAKWRAGLKVEPGAEFLRYELIVVVLGYQAMIIHNQVFLLSRNGVTFL